MRIPPLALAMPERVVSAPRCFAKRLSPAQLRVLPSLPPSLPAWPHSPSRPQPDTEARGETSRPRRQPPHSPHVERSKHGAHSKRGRPGTRQRLRSPVAKQESGFRGVSSGSGVPETAGRASPSACDCVVGADGRVCVHGTGPAAPRRKAAAALRPLVDATRASVLTPVVLLLQGEQQPRLGWWGRRCRRTRGPEPRPGPERSVRLPVPGAGRGGGESGPRSTARCFLAARPRATALCPAPKTRLALGRGRGRLSPFGAALCARLPALRRGVTA